MFSGSGLWLPSRSFSSVTRGLACVCSDGSSWCRIICSRRFWTSSWEPRSISRNSMIPICRLALSARMSLTKCETTLVLPSLAFPSVVAAAAPFRRPAAFSNCLSTACLLSYRLMTSAWRSLSSFASSSMRSICSWNRAMVRSASFQRWIADR